jgi:caffeoyl-CoA O-methyltransferase
MQKQFLKKTLKNSGIFDPGHFYPHLAPLMVQNYMISKNTEQDYCEAYTSAPGKLLADLDRETHLKTLSPQMQSGAYQGKLLQFISQMIQPKRILEIGTFSGYATICLAAGLPDEGQLHTIEVNDEMGWIIQKYLRLAALDTKVVLHLGDAATIVPKLEDGFDLVFMDAGKLDYLDHYNMVLPKMRSGGFLLADNVLWDGKVASGDTKDETAKALRDFNSFVHADERVENLLLPIRDGLMLVRKR